MMAQDFGSSDLPGYAEGELPKLPSVQAQFKERNLFTEM